ncbi:hypothetical protein JL722_3180 [Aureococcus anophagefferens]|nr:hypothetical protein JL722_3180 [Aureococcus anophagefferens]
MLRFVLLVTAATSLELGRRDALRCLAASCATPAAVAGAAPIDAAPLNAWESYAVLGDSASFNPSARAVAPRTLVAQLARRRAVFLGEHHDAVADHALQAQLVARSAEPSRPLAVGFEAVQQRFQPALDAYGAGKLSERRLAAATEWEQRWSWPFEAYAPVFRAAKAAKADLLALNVDGEDAAKVSAAGLAGLDRAARGRYLPDPQGFAAFAKTVAFKSYVGYAIRPSYALHVELGILPATTTSECVGNDASCTTSFKNFLANRVLWDEAMASVMETRLASKPGGLAVGVVGADHVKFGCGAANRLARRLPGAARVDDVATVLLNPRPSDTRGDETGGVERGGAPLPRRGGRVDYDSLAGSRDVARGGDGLVNFAEYTLQLRFAPVPAVDDWVGNETAAPGEYAGAWDCAVASVRAEGVAALYKGLLVPLLAQGAYKAIMFGVYGACRRRVTESTGRSELKPSEIFACGAVAGGANAFVLTPVELVRNGAGKG